MFTLTRVAPSMFILWHRRRDLRRECGLSTLTPKPIRKKATGLLKPFLLPKSCSYTSMCMLCGCCPPKYRQIMLLWTSWWWCNTGLYNSYIHTFCSQMSHRCWYVNDSASVYFRLSIYFSSRHFNTIQIFVVSWWGIWFASRVWKSTANHHILNYANVHQGQ